MWFSIDIYEVNCRQCTGFNIVWIYYRENFKYFFLFEIHMYNKISKSLSDLNGPEKLLLLYNVWSSTIIFCILHYLFFIKCPKVKGLGKKWQATFFFKSWRYDNVLMTCISCFHIWYFRHSLHLILHQGYKSWNGLHTIALSFVVFVSCRFTKQQWLSKTSW